MIALIILLSVVLLLIWIFFSPIELFIDTRRPIVAVRWRTIGNVSIQFEENEFWLRGQILSITWRWQMKEIQSKPKEEPSIRKKKRKANFQKLIRRMWRMIRTFHIKQFEVAFSPEDYCLSGQLYPLNYLSAVGLKNVEINFRGENYLVARIVSAPWRMMYAFIRK